MEAQISGGEYSFMSNVRYHMLCCIITLIFVISFNLLKTYLYIYKIKERYRNLVAICGLKNYHIHYWLRLLPIHVVGIRRALVQIFY